MACVIFAAGLKLDFSSLRPHCLKIQIETREMSVSKTVESKLRLIMETWDIAQDVPYEHKTWSELIDKAFRAEPVRSKRALWQQLSNLATVPWGTDRSNPDNPKEKRGIPLEGLELLLDKLAAHVRSSRTELVKELFKSTVSLDLSQSTERGDLASYCVDECVIPQHLQWLYEQAGRPEVPYAFVANLAMVEISILKHNGQIESLDGPIPLDKVRAVFEANESDVINEMVTVKTFGLERVTEALQAVHQSEDPWAEPEEC